MHLSWFMYLFILILFGELEFICVIYFYFIYIYLGLFSSGRASRISYDTEETDEKYEGQHSFLITSKIITSSILGETENYVVNYEDENKKTIETTTQMKKTTKHHDYSNHEHVEYYDHEDEKEDEEVSSTTHTTTTSLSSSSTTRLIAHVITETTTSKAEIPLRRSTLAASTDLYHFFIETLPTTTIDPKQIAEFLAKTSKK